MSPVAVRAGGLRQAWRCCCASSPWLEESSQELVFHLVSDEQGRNAEMVSRVVQVFDSGNSNSHGSPTSPAVIASRSHRVSSAASPRLGSHLLASALSAGGPANDG
jgi:hypothetical protein